MDPDLLRGFDGEHPDEPGKAPPGAHWGETVVFLSVVLSLSMWGSYSFVFQEVCGHVSCVVSQLEVI